MVQSTGWGRAGHPGLLKSSSGRTFSYGVSPSKPDEGNWYLDVREFTQLSGNGNDRRARREVDSLAKRKRGKQQRSVTQVYLTVRIDPENLGL